MPFFEKISLGNFVAGLGGFDAEDLSAQVVGVTGGALGISLGAPVTVIDGRVAIALEGIRVVSHGEVEQTIWTELDRASVMADFVIPLDRDIDEFQLGLRIEFSIFQSETGEAVHQFVGGTVENIHALVVGEIRV